MAEDRTAATDRVPLTLPALRVEVEHLRDELEGMRNALAEEGKKLRSAAEAASRERDLERERRERAEEELRRVRTEVEGGRAEREARIRAEERVRAIDEAATLVERNLSAILERREKSISEKDRVIASLARALGSAEKERDILVEAPAARPATILRRLLGGGRRTVVEVTPPARPAPAPAAQAAPTPPAPAPAPAPAP